MNQRDRRVYFKLEAHAGTQEFVITYANTVAIQQVRGEGGFSDEDAKAAAWQGLMGKNGSSITECVL